MPLSILLRQVILLTIAIAVPLGLLLFRKHYALLTWIGATLFVQIFDTTIVTNLPAGRLVGLVYLPIALMAWSRLVRNQNVRYALMSIAYGAVLSIIFGYIHPWPDVTGVRSWTLRAQGKAIIYLARTISDLSLATYIYIQGMSGEAMRSLRRGLVAGATLTSAAGILQALGGPALFITLSGLRADVLEKTFRSQGLSYEPRGLGLAAAWGFFMVLAPGQKPTRRSLFVALVCFVGLIVSGSVSGVALFVFGGLVAVFSGVGSGKRTRRIIAAILIGILLVSIWLMGNEMRIRVRYYMDAQNRVGDTQVHGVIDSLIAHLDIFDASALNFLSHNPLYALTGTGLGLVCLPASSYIPPGVYSDIWDIHLGKGLDSPPTHGLLVEISNGGVIALALWIAQVLVALRLTYPRRKKPPMGWTPRDWVFFGRFIRYGVIFYIVQNSISPTWAITSAYLFLAADLRRRRVLVIDDAEARQHERRFPVGVALPSES